jgi:hypothetical protein
MWYTIKSGNHYANTLPLVDFPYLPPKVHFGITEMSGNISFSPSCAYTLTDTTCVNDTNKAYGFSYGDHKKWSIRLAWRVHNDGKLELFNFCHVNGKMVMKRLGGAKQFFEYNTLYPFTITYDVNAKLATVNVNGIEASIPFNIEVCAGYDCRPYFGGNCTAPHDMKILINLN